MEIWQEKLKQVFKSSPHTRDTLGEAVDLSAAQIGHILNGTRSTSIETLRRICTALNIDMSKLLDSTETNNDLLASNNNIEITRNKYIPKKILGSISAGNLKEIIASDSNQDGLEIVYFPFKYNSNRYFALKIDGNSMTNSANKYSFEDNNFAVFEKRSAYPNDYVLIYDNSDGSGMFKKLVKEGSSYLLVPLNDHYPIREMTEHQEIIGAMVYYQPRGLDLKINGKNY